MGQDVDMTSGGCSSARSDDEEEYVTTRWVCTEYMEQELAAKVAAEESDRFSHAVESLESALSAAKVSSDFSAVHAKYSSLNTFYSARCELRPEDLRRCAYVVLDIIYAVAGDISAQARWGGMVTRILELGHGKKLKLEIEWRPLYDVLMSYLDGQSEGYNGAIPLAVHQAVISRLAQKARRHFSEEAPKEIWETLKPKIKCVDTMDCFEGVGLLHLLMPCCRVATTRDLHPWAEWMEEWIDMSSWMPTNRFWLAGWHGIFAQLSKHDVEGGGAAAGM